MKKLTKKLVIASVFACALTTASLGAIAWNSASATVVTDANITMVDGASLRPENTELEIVSGLRFKTEINKDWYDREFGDNAKVYTLLVPTATLGETELTAECKGTHGAIEADVNEGLKYTVKDAQGTEKYRFNVVLTDIPANYYTKDISVRSYITDGTKTYYATNTVSRSVVYVANRAIELDIESNTNKYESVEKYVVSGVEVNDTGYELNGTDRAIKAELTYHDGVSDAVKARLNAKYPDFTYSVKTADNNAAIDSETGVMTITTAGVATVEVSNEALGFSDTATVTAYTPTYGELINFDNIDTTLIVGHTCDYKVVGNGIQFDLKVEKEGSYYAGIQLNPYYPAWVTNFDTVSFTVALKAETGTGASSMSWYAMGSDKYGRLYNPGDTKKFTFPASNAQFYYNNGAYLRFFLQNNNKTLLANATFLISDITLNINDIESAGETVNLYNKFYTSEGNATFTFTPSGSTTGTAIENPTAFLAGQSGTITATISAEGYDSGTVTANYVRKLAYGTLVDFNAIDESALTAFNTTTLKVVPYNGKQAIAMTETDTDSSTVSPYFGVNINSPSWLFDFDTITIKAVLLEEVLAEGATKNSYCLFSKTDESVKAKYWVNASTPTLGTTLSLGSGASDDKGEHNGHITKEKLKLTWCMRYNCGQVTATILITDITFGYNDIAVTSGTPISILDTLGYTAEELTNVTFDGEAVEDVTAFAPTAGGTLSFTVNKEGYAPATFTTNVVVS